MRLFLVSLSLAILALSLAGYCFVQVPLIKKRTEVVLSDLEERFLMERSHLSPQEVERLDSHLRTLRFNSRAVHDAHTRLWRAGVLGFLGLGIANLVVAGVAYKKHKVQKANVAS